MFVYFFALANRVFFPAFKIFDFEKSWSADYLFWDALSPYAASKRPKVGKARDHLMLCKGYAKLEKLPKSQEILEDVLVVKWFGRRQPPKFPISRSFAGRKYPQPFRLGYD